MVFGSEFSIASVCLPLQGALHRLTGLSLEKFVVGWSRSAPARIRSMHFPARPAIPSGCKLDKVFKQLTLLANSSGYVVTHPELTPP